MLEFLKNLFIKKKEIKLNPKENIRILIRLAEFACRNEKNVDEMIMPIRQALRLALKINEITQPEYELLEDELELARDIELGDDKKSKYLGFVAWSKVRNFLLKRCL